MKTKTLAVTLALAAGLAAVGAAQAEGKIYVGAKIGDMNPDFAGFNDVHTLGIYGGYNLLGKDAHFASDLRGGTLAVEGEVNMTATKAKAGPAGKWDITELGVYAAYRHPVADNFYLKGKAGLVRYDINTTVPSAYSGTETKLSLGIGGGYKVGPGNLEAEITTYESNVLFVSAGFHMAF